jgi:hypothetical protein
LAVRSGDRANSRRSAKAVAKRGSRVRSQVFVGIQVRWRHRARPAGHIARAVAGAQGERAARAYGIPAYGLHRADLLQVLANAAGDADLRTGQRVTVMVQHDWSGEFAGQRIAELASRRPDQRCLTHRTDNGRRACAGHVREDR